MNIKAITFSLLSIALVGCFARPAEKTGLEGKVMPAFNLLLTDSTTHLNTGSIPNGKPVVLFYFGPQCPYSHAQMEEITENMDNLKDIRFYIFTTAPFTAMKGFYEHYQLNKYRNITVGVDYSNFFADYFKAPGVPYIAIYGKSKKLNAAFLGKTYSKQIKSHAEE